MSEEENINQSADDRPLSTEDQTISEPSTINYQLSTNMEVHKHPHHITHKKKWGEYFLEFLMIFLAVTLGFFAENLREYFKDKTEIKSDMQSMIADLQSDVSMYNFSIATNKLSDRSEE